MFSDFSTLVSVILWLFDDAVLTDAEWEANVILSDGKDLRGGGRGLFQDFPEFLRGDKRKTMEKGSQDNR
jgi:hypothetical protein